MILAVHSEFLPRALEVHQQASSQAPLPGSSAGSSPVLAVSGALALIGIEGVIVRGLSPVWAGLATDPEWIIQACDEIAQRPEVRTVVLKCDSPGGIASGHIEAAARIERLAASGRRVLAYSETICASLCYELACATQEIHAAPSARVGSIGCKLILADTSGAWAADGVKWEFFQSGDLKSLGDPRKPMSDPERAEAQAIVTREAERFVGYVMKRRPGLRAEGAFRGQTWSAWQAPDGMVDSPSATVRHDTLADFIRSLR